MKKPPCPLINSINGDQYQVTSPFSVDFGDWLTDFQFTIPDGFTTDIASVPRVLRFLYDRASLGLLAPVVHDYLCDHGGQVTSKSGQLLHVGWFDVNLLFLLLMRLDGVPWHRAFLAFLAVTIASPKW